MMFINAPAHPIASSEIPNTGNGHTARPNKIHRMRKRVNMHNVTVSSDCLLKGCHEIKRMKQRGYAGNCKCAESSSREARRKETTLET
jgi:hypothetical protein